MSSLKWWDEIDFITVLEVLPEIEEYEVSHLFKVERDGLFLEVCVWQLEKVLRLDLYRKGIETPIIGCAFYVRGDARRVHEKSQEYLEIRNCLPVPSRFSYRDFDKDLHNPKAIQYGLTLRVYVNPHIRIEYVRAPSVK